MPRVRFLTTPEVANIFRCDLKTISRWCRENRFPGAIQPGRWWLIPESDVLALTNPIRGELA